MKFLLLEGLKYQPDLVILGFFSGNDLYENIRAADLQRNNGELYRNHIKTGLISQIKKWLRLRFHAYRFLGDKYNLILTQYGTKNARVKDEYHYGIFQKEFPPIIENAWQVTKQIVVDMRETLNRQEIDMIVLNIPRLYEIQDEQWNKFVRRYNYDKRFSLDPGRPSKMIGMIAQESRIKLVDLVPVLKKQSRPEALYFPHNGHWTPKGHAIVAEVLFDKILSNTGLGKILIGIESNSDNTLKSENLL